MSDTEKNGTGKSAHDKDDDSSKEPSQDGSRNKGEDKTEMTFRIVFEDDDDVMDTSAAPEGTTDADTGTDAVDAAAGDDVSDDEAESGNDAVSASAGTAAGETRTTDSMTDSGDGGDSATEDSATESPDGERNNPAETAVAAATPAVASRQDSAEAEENTPTTSGISEASSAGATSQADEETEATEIVDHEIRAERRRMPAEDDILLRSYPTFALHGATVVNRKTGRRPLDEVSLSFYAGTVYGVTAEDEDPEQRRDFLALASGLIRPAEGSVTSRSADLLELDAAETRGHRIGVVPQDFDLRDDLTAVDNIVYAMDASNRTFLKPKPALARELLGQVGFGKGAKDSEDTPDDGTGTPTDETGADAAPITAADPMTVPVRSLAPLDRRLASIARAISCEAEVLVLDEPTHGLDDDEASTVLSILANLAHGDPRRCILVVSSKDDVLDRTEQVVELS